LAVIYLTGTEVGFLTSWGPVWLLLAFIIVSTLSRVYDSLEDNSALQPNFSMSSRLYVRACLSSSM